MWYHEVIGKSRCPIVDTWWQTETGMILIAPLPGAIATKPGSATRPLPGVVADIVDRHGNRCRPTRAACWSSGSPGRPCCGRSSATTNAIASNTGRRCRTCYFTADGARRDEDGYFWIMGRVDDVLNVSGPSPEHDGSRERPGPSSQGGGGGRGRQAGRDQGRGHRLLRHAGRRRRSRRRP